MRLVDGRLVGTPHCCVCTGVCGHIGGPWFCAAHDPRCPVTPAVPAAK